MKSQKRQNWIRTHALANGDGPAIPVLPQTMLLLEIEMQERCVDLKRFSQIILSDLGATIQLLHMVGREYGTSAGIARIGDYITDLGIQACFEAMFRQVARHDARYARISKFWARCRDVAERSRRAAEEISELNPDGMYLAGLLHSIHELPQILGWDEAFEAYLGDGADLARRLDLPEFVCRLIHEGQAGKPALPWMMGEGLDGEWNEGPLDYHGQRVKRSEGLYEFPILHVPAISRLLPAQGSAGR